MEKEEWTSVIESNKGKSFSFSEIWNYRDLVLLFVRRDFVKEFKQTILGPLWFIIQPVFQTFVLVFMFGKVGGLAPENVPTVSFFLGGVLLWNLFSDILLKTSETFRANADIFGKVYFPRMVMPFAQIITSGLKFSVQLVFFVIVYSIEVYNSPFVEANLSIFLFPVYVIITAILATGIGLIISSMTTKYWDLRFLVQFGVQLLMYVSTVAVPLVSTTMVQMKGGWMEKLILANPISSLVEGMRYAFFGDVGGVFHKGALLYSSSVAVVTLVLGVFIFNRVERNFMDTV